MSKNRGDAYWNDEAQRWEPGVDPASVSSAGRRADEAGPRSAPEHFVGYGPPGSLPRFSRVGVPAVVAVAVLLVGGLVGGWLLLGDDDGDQSAGGRSSVSASAPETEAPPPPDELTPSAEAPEADRVPEGYELVQDEKGFSTAVPEGWKRSEDGVQVYYTSPDQRRMLQISTPSGLMLTPYQALQQTSEGLRADRPGYEEVELKQLNDGTAKLVYAYDSQSLGERRMAMDVAFLTSGSRQYAVLAIGPAAEWPDQGTRVGTALRHFVPAPGA